MNPSDKKTPSPDDQMKVLNLQDLPDEAAIGGGFGPDGWSTLSAGCAPDTGCTMSVDCNTADRPY